MGMLYKMFNKISNKVKPPKEILKELQEEMLIEQMGLSEEYEIIQNPLFIARINFENFKACFKRDPSISRSGAGGCIDKEKMKITRFRESDAKGNMSKYIDSIRIIDNGHNQHYVGMINRAYGIKASIEDGYIYMNYDIKQIEEARIKK